MNGQGTLFQFLFGFDVSPKMVFKRILKGVLWLVAIPVLFFAYVAVVDGLNAQGLIDENTAGFAVSLVPKLILGGIGLMFVFAVIKPFLFAKGISAVLSCAVIAYLIDPVFALFVLFIVVVGSCGSHSSPTRKSGCNANDDFIDPKPLHGGGIYTPEQPDADG